MAHADEETGSLPHITLLLPVSATGCTGNSAGGNTWEMESAELNPTMTEGAAEPRKDGSEDKPSECNRNRRTTNIRGAFEANARSWSFTTNACQFNSGGKCLPQSGDTGTCFPHPVIKQKNQLRRIWLAASTAVRFPSVTGVAQEPSIRFTYCLNPPHFRSLPTSLGFLNLYPRGR